MHTKFHQIIEFFKSNGVQIIWWVKSTIKSNIELNMTYCDMIMTLVFMFGHDKSKIQPF